MQTKETSTFPVCSGFWKEAIHSHTRAGVPEPTCYKIQATAPNGG
jgi:hypothetical protein